MQERAQDFAGLPKDLTQSQISLGRDSLPNKVPYENLDDRNSLSQSLSFVKPQKQAYASPAFKQNKASTSPEVTDKLDVQLLQPKTYITPTKNVTVAVIPAGEFVNEFEGLSAHSGEVI